jgi:hypothetical protein
MKLIFYALHIYRYILKIIAIFGAFSGTIATKTNSYQDILMLFERQIFSLLIDIKKCW